MTISDFEAHFLGHVPGLMGQRSSYAVLVPLVEWQGQLHILFEVRADTLTRQPNEVCFPGGRMEPGEGPTECAIRETGEELGIPPSAIRPIARLDILYMPRGDLMHPVLAQVEAEAVEHMRPNAGEVKETFLVPVEYFLTREPLVYTYPLEPHVGDDFPYELIGFRDNYRWRGDKVEVPIWDYQGYAIWGLTARILNWNLRGGGSSNPFAVSL